MFYFAQGRCWSCKDRIRVEICCHGLTCPFNWCNDLIFLIISVSYSNHILRLILDWSITCRCLTASACSPSPPSQWSCLLQLSSLPPMSLSSEIDVRIFNTTLRYCLRKGQAPSLWSFVHPMSSLSEDSELPSTPTVVAKDEFEGNTGNVGIFCHHVCSFQLLHVDVFITFLV